VKGTYHKAWCVDGCNGQNSKLKWVGNFLAVLSKGASQTRLITSAIKKFMQQECTELLGFGRDCYYKNL
jgi:hypothetical protein